jgi:glycosyltransferase involved in cell wall biosynthesis
MATPAGDRFEVLMNERDITLRSSQTGPLKLLFIGNLIPRKGLHTLIAALGFLSGENWVLQIIGRESVDPGYVKRLKSQILQAGLEDKIRFLGEVPDVRMAHLMGESQVLVMPSSYEGFGIVHLEGMAFGLPSVASLAGGAQEIIKNGQNGYLVEPGDINQLALVLHELYQNRELLLKLSLQARHDYSNFPTWETSMEKVRQFLLTWEKYPDG